MFQGQANYLVFMVLLVGIPLVVLLIKVSFLSPKIERKHFNGIYGPQTGCNTIKCCASCLHTTIQKSNVSDIRLALLWLTRF